MNTLTELFCNSVAQRIGWSLIHFLWQGAAVALVLAVTLSLLRNRSAQARWAVCCAALALMAVLPVVTALAVSVEAPTLPQVAPVAVAVEVVWPPAPQVLPAGPLTDPEASINTRTPSSPAARGQAAPAPWHRQLECLLRPALPWATIVWLAGVLAMSFWHVGGWLQVWRLRRFGTRPAGSAIQATFDELIQRLHIRRPVGLLESLRVAVPVVAGWLRPVVLLPVGVITGLTPRQLEAVLAHELAHIRRWDCLVQALQAVMETLLFYHPAVWWVSRQIRQESEQCCDDLAVGVCGDRHGYVRALAKVAELGVRKPAFAAAATGGKLLPRIRRVLGAERPGALSFGRCLSGVLALATIIAVGIAVGVSCSSQRGPKTDHVDKMTATQPDTSPATSPATLPGLPQTAPAGAAVRAARPASGPVTDYLPDLMDNYSQSDEAKRFYAAAGADRVLTQEEWNTAAGMPNSFVRPYDCWEAAAKGGTRLNLARAVDYRIGVQKVLLAEFDKDKDGKLTGTERHEANAFLAQGIRPPKLDRPGAGSQPSGPRAREEAEQWWVLRYDANKNGALDANEGAKWQQDVAKLKEDLVKLQEEFQKAQQEWNKNWDKDGDGRFSAEEAEQLQAGSAKLQAESAMLHAEWINRWDSDGDGKLSDDERMVADWCVLTGEAKRRLGMDSDGDGQVTAQESQAYWEKVRVKYDLDKDGKLSDDERQRMRKEEGLEGDAWVLSGAWRVGGAGGKREPLASQGGSRPTASGSAPATQPTDDWGPANDGVRIRLRADKRLWVAGQTPTFRADIRNIGKGEYSVARAQEVCELDLDGTRYRWVGETSVISSVLAPGREYRDIPVALTDNWRTKEGNKPLDLKPGRHTLRVLFFCDGGSSNENLVVDTNAVEFEVAVAPTVPATQPATQPQAPMQVRLDNGVSVELVGLASYPSTGKQWWSPDGKPLASSPYQRLGLPAGRSERDRANLQQLLDKQAAQPGTVEVAIKLEHLEDADVRVRWGFPLGPDGSGSPPYDHDPSSGGVFTALVPLMDGQPVPGLYVAVAGVPKNMKIDSVQVSIAAGRWTVVAAGGADCRNSFVSLEGRGEFIDTSQTEDGTKLVFSDTFVDRDCRVVAVAKDGTEHVGQVLSEGQQNSRVVEAARGRAEYAGKVLPSEGVRTTVFHFAKLLPNQIKEFSFQTRVFESADFKNVSFPPGSRPTSSLGGF